MIYHFKIMKQNEIYEVVTDNFLTSGESNKTKRPLKIFKGEKIEIRYPYDWHFRTEKNEYFHAKEEEILKNCKLIGVINEKIAWENLASLEEILRLKLYKPIK